MQHLTLLALFFELENFVFPTLNFNFFLKNKILAFAVARNFGAWEGKVMQGAIKCALQRGMGRERVPKKRYCTSWLAWFQNVRKYLPASKLLDFQKISVTP